ncbi:MAG TPA: DUF748 domain-containing protein [Holophaga sp.]|nr:DUF748 domain-containing protein [Holophaga sp.]
MKIPALLNKLPRRVLRMGLWGLGLVGAYALLGFLVLPPILASQAPKRLSALLGRSVTIQRVRTNPFTLSATVDGLRIQDRDGGTLLAWRRLHVNWQLRSLFGRTQHFKVLELEEPQGRLVVEQDGSLNIRDIVARFEGQPAEPPSGPPTELAIQHLRIGRARLELRDHTPSEPFATTLGPVTVVVEDFHTRRDSHSPYRLEGATESGERFRWQGTFALEPLASEGELVLEGLSLAKYAPYYRDQVAFELRKGTLSARAAYRFAWSEGRHELKLREGSLQLSDLDLGAPGAALGDVVLPRLDLQGLEADLLAPAITIQRLTLVNPRIRYQRRSDGTINLAELFTPKPSPEPETPSKPLSLAVAKMALENGSVSYQDAATPRPVNLDIPDLDLSVEGFSLDPKVPAQAALGLSLAQGGRLEARGPLWALRPAMDLEVKAQDLPLAPFDPYLEPDLALRVNRGTVSATLRFLASFEGRPSDRMDLKGRLDLRDFEAMDAVGQEPFLRYRRFLLEGIDLALGKRRMGIAQVTLEAPEQRLVVAADGTTNVGRALKLAPAPETPTAQALPPTPEQPFALTLSNIRLAGGRLSFIDRSLKPAAALLVSDLEGRYEGLSTEPDALSKVDLKGLAGGVAPLHIQGRTMPLRTDLDTDVTLSLKGADLTDFSPYAGKYLGYGIRKGKLDVEARVRIERRVLDARVQTRMDQFFLGSKVESPDATRLPVRLALAILRDRKGVIDLDLPVEGSLDDPNYRYGRIVWKAIVNVLTKIATSPFALLGKLGGAGERDLSQVAFGPGLASLDDEARRTVEALAKALADRPELALELEGSADPAADGLALRRQILEERLRETKRRTLQVRQPGQDADAVQVTPEERDAWLKAAFLAAFPQPPVEKGQTAPPLPPPAEQEQRLLETLPVAPEALRKLSDARVLALLETFTGAGIEPARLFKVEGGARARKEGGAKVYFTLK